MQILRHSRIAITMEIYTEVPSAATREALRKLGLWLEDTEGLVTWRVRRDSNPNLLIRSDLQPDRLLVLVLTC